MKRHDFNLERARRALPDARLAPSAPQGRPPRFVAGLHTIAVEKTFSGSTYHLAIAGMGAGQLEGCFSLRPPGKRDVELEVRASLWKLARFLAGRKGGGFKFTGGYSDAIWKIITHLFLKSTIISNFYLFGDFFINKVKKFK